MSLPLSYRDFLKAKIVMAPVAGFTVADHEINPLLKPFQRAIVKWACLGGRRAIFAAFGLGKTFMQIELLRLVLAYLPAVRGDDRYGALICAPLGVRREFFRDARVLMTGDDPNITNEQRAELAAWLEGHPERRIDLAFIRSIDEAKRGRLHITNYETVRDGKVDPRLFSAATLDEASCLRGFGGSKTFREFMRLFDGMRFKFVATATPSPNEFIEMLAYSAFLEVMDVGQAKTRFFKRNSEKADTLTIHPHKEREFWLWVASWGLFVHKPSDLDPTFSDEGYDLPALDIHWHELPSDHEHAGEEKSGQGRLLRNSAASLPEAAREKRDSLAVRVAKMMELRALDPTAHRIIWHDLEAERHAIEKAIPEIATVFGSQDLDTREKILGDFAEGRIPELAGKPSMLGSGSNFQRYCWWAVFIGIGFKFNDFIQAVHRILRFLQTHEVRLDLIYTEAERPVRDALEAKWRRHDQQMAIMTDIIRKYGLSAAAMAQTLERAMGVERVAVLGENYTLVNNDCVEEVKTMAADSVDLIITSIPFSTQYEYSPNYADFGHTDSNPHFWEQMDFLIPELLRVLKPGRVAAIHVKDRIVPGGMTSLGYQTVYPFSDDCIRHFCNAGFGFLARKTVVTDVVRENNQTYRLGWSEECKDGSKIGAGLPEYLLIFRKTPSDTSNGYADEPVRKLKKEWLSDARKLLKEKIDPDDRAELSERLREEYDAREDSGNWEEPAAASSPAVREGRKGVWRNPGGYSRARWQVDAHGFQRSSGDRLLSGEELRSLDADVIYRLWKDFSLSTIYDFEHHVRIGETLDAWGSLPKKFMLLPPHSNHPDVWSDVARMRTMNMLQAAGNREMHLCPLQFDIVDRAVAQYSQPGELIFDPFAGLGTVPYRALKLGRRGMGVELNGDYFFDACQYVEAVAREMAMPSLFDLMNAEAPEVAAE